MFNTSYISTVEKTDAQYHRSPVIIHKDWQWYLAEFQNSEQLDYMAHVLGFTYTLRKEEESKRFGVYREYDINRKFQDAHFRSNTKLPENAKPMKALSNGAIVTCYFVNDGETITIYRPNPNDKDIYKPLPIEQHIAHQRIYGSI